MEALTRPNGLTRKALRLVHSEEELQSMLARLQSILERFTPGDGAGSLRKPISLREQEAVLHGVEMAVRGAVAYAALEFSPERPTEPQPGPDPDSPERQPQPVSVSPVQPTELQRQFRPVSPERPTEPQPEPDSDSPERQRQPGSDSPERQPGSNSAELLPTEPLSPPVLQRVLVPRGSVAVAVASRSLELEQIAQPVVGVLAVIHDHLQQPAHVLEGCTVCDCGAKARRILLPYMRLMPTLPQPWYNLEVHTAQGSPFMWNFILGVAKSQHEFYGHFVKGSKGLAQITRFSHMLRPRALSPITDKLWYIWNHLTDFLRARRLLDVIQKRLEAPKLDREGWVTYYAKELPEEAKRWHEQHGSHWHGTRLQCLSNILVRGLRDSNPAITEGSRTLVDDGRSNIGVHFFQERDWVMSRHCLRHDFVGANR